MKTGGRGSNKEAPRQGVFIHLWTMKSIEGEKGAGGSSVLLSVLGVSPTLTCGSLPSGAVHSSAGVGVVVERVLSACLIPTWHRASFLEMKSRWDEFFMRKITPACSRTGMKPGQGCWDSLEDCRSFRSTSTMHANGITSSGSRSERLRRHMAAWISTNLAADSPIRSKLKRRVGVARE
jgi:hypothetical protein